uniref:Uncharacterized protein n=1 Tax=Solanum lycopersicum TaxID=4081 RepID=K4CDV8_SOLLC
MAIKRSRLGNVVHHPIASMAGIKRPYLQWRREVEIVASKEAENKRYAALQAQLTFLYDYGNILPPCPARSDDGADQEGDENDKGDRRVTVMRSSCICLKF